MSNIYNDNQDNKISKKTVAGIFIAVFILWTVAWLLLSVFGGTSEERGLFGDMFGSVNALFSGFAFAGIIITILLQSNELKLQRDELQETREEFKIQNETLKLQRFENTFFNLLNLHQQIVINNEGVVGSAKYKGRDLFQSRYFEFRNELKKAKTDEEIKIKDIYEKYYYEHASKDFGQYFKNLYRTIKFIDANAAITEEEKYTYMAILKAQLSDYELLWLFYNCLNYPKFKLFAEKYTLLDDLADDELANKEHKAFYSNSAFIKSGKSEI